MRNLVLVLLMTMVFQIPWEDLVFFGSFGTLIRAIGMGTFFLGIVAVLTTGRFRGLLLIHYMMILFVAFCALSLVWTQDGEATLRKCMTYCQLLAFVCLIWEFAPDAFRQKMLMHAYIWGGGLGILIQFLGLQTYTAMTHEEERFSAGRMNLNEFSIMLIMTIPMAVYFAIDPKVNKLMRIAYLLYCPVCAISILLTGSRMGFIVVCAMGAMVGFIYLLKRPVFTIGSTLLAGVIFLFLFPKIMPESTWERLTKTRDELQTGTWSGRIIIWEAGFALFQQYPVLGTGSGTALRVIGQALGASRPIAAHNTYLSMSVELGVVGLLLFMSILIVALIYTFKMPFRERYTWSIILISWTLCAFAGSLEDEKLLWLILGLIACQFATFTEKGVAKIRAEPLGTLGPGRQLLVRPRWGNTRGT